MTVGDFFLKFYNGQKTFTKNITVAKTKAF